MDTVLHTYAPAHAYLDQTTLLALLILLIALGGLWWNYRRKVAPAQRNMRQLIGMLLGFVVLIAAATSFFSWLTSERIQPIKVYADRIESNEGTIFAKQIKRIYFEQSIPQAPFKLNALADTTLLLVVENVEGGKTAHVFSEENYPIQQMVKDLRPWLLNATKE